MTLRESTTSLDNKSVVLDDDCSINKSVYAPKRTQVVEEDHDNENILSEMKEDLTLSINNFDTNIKKSIELNTWDNEQKDERISHGNRINPFILEKNKNVNTDILNLKIDKEKSSKEGYTIYEIYSFFKNKKSNEIEKKIYCYRRYDNFNTFNKVLKDRYPQYIFPKLSPKIYYNKIINVDEEIRRFELQYYINEIYNHSIIGKNEEFHKFLTEAKFDKDYFKSLGKRFYYPEIKKILDNTGLISNGVNTITNMVTNNFNYYIMGKKNCGENNTPKSKNILKEEKKVNEKIEKYKLTLTEIKNIYNALKEENKIKNDISKNFVFLKGESNNEENDEIIKTFNELTNINSDYDNKKNLEYLESFDKKIIKSLEFCILNLEGEAEAIKRYKTFLQDYNNIINYKIQDKDNKVITYEQTKIKEDIELYEETLINEINKINENTTKNYNDVINNLFIYLYNDTEEFINKYNNTHIANSSK